MGRLSRNMLNCSGTLLTGTPSTEWSFEAFSSLQSARNDNSCGLQFMLDQSLRKNAMPLSVIQGMFYDHYNISHVIRP